jgi:hypothetical protein
MATQDPSGRPEPIPCPLYRSFLLRCWREEINGEPNWRFTLVQLGGKGAKRGFASLEAVTVYLETELASSMREKK